MHLCPICGFAGLDEPPYNPEGHGSYEICSSCSFQYGYHDESEGITHEEWRADWIRRGMPWNSAAPPPDSWNPRTQLARIGVDPDVVLRALGRGSPFATLDSDHTEDHGEQFVAARCAGLV
jgi:hypothetical protein